MRTTSTNFDDPTLTVTTTSDDTAINLITQTVYDAVGRVQSISDGAGNQVQKGYLYGSNFGACGN